MPVKLNTTTSIIDYLASKNQDSSFSARKKLWNEMGLNTRLGDYTGSAIQNPAFISALQSSSTYAPSFDTNATYPATGAQPIGSPMFPYQAPTMGNQSKTPYAPGFDTNTIYPNDAGIPATGVKAQPSATFDPNATYPATGAVNTAVTQPTTPATNARNTVTSNVPPPTETPAADSLSSLGFDINSLTKGMTQEELMAAVENDPGFKLYMEAVQNKTLGEQATAEAKKAELEKTAEATKTEMEQKLAERGLAFSGIRTQAVQDLAASLATSKLGVDRQLALNLLETDVNQRGKFLDIAADLLKDANEQNKSALDQLNKAGYALVGGQLLPTAEALRIASTADTAEFNQAIAIRRLQIAEQNATTQSEKNDILNQIRAITLQQKTAVAPGQYIQTATGLPASMTAAEKDTLNKMETVSEYYIPTLQDMLTGLETGALVGKLNKYSAKLPVVQNMRDEDLSMFNALASYFSQQIVYMNSGKQINENEMKILYQSLPSAELTVTENLNRLEQFGKITNQAYSRYLRSAGISKAPGIQTGNTGDTVDLSDLDFLL